MGGPMGVADLGAQLLANAATLLASSLACPEQLFRIGQSAGVREDAPSQRSDPRGSPPRPRPRPASGCFRLVQAGADCG